MSKPNFFTASAQMEEGLKIDPLPEGERKMNLENKEKLGRGSK